MKILRVKKTPQSMIEYCIFIAVLAAVLYGMQVYARRGLQATLKRQSDQFVDHREIGTIWEEEEAPWALQVDSGSRGTAQVKNVNKETIIDGRYRGVKLSESTNEFYASSVSNIIVDDVDGSDYEEADFGVISEVDPPDMTSRVTEDNCINYTLFLECVDLASYEYQACYGNHYGTSYVSDDDNECIYPYTMACASCFRINCEN